MSITFDATGATVVGTDLSDRAGVAVDWAARRAQLSGGRLLIVMAVPQVPIPRRSRLFEAMASGDWPERALRDAEAQLAELRDRVARSHPDLEVGTHVERSMASYALAQASKTADLVVVGARGAHAPMRVRALGGTADAVVQHAHGPVAVITDHTEFTPDGPVVVGVDDSPEGEAALRMAASEAATRGVRLRAVHAFDVAAWMVGPMDAGFDIVPMLGEVHQQVEALVRHGVRDHPDLEVTVEVPTDRAASALIEASRGASVVVVGARGLGGFVGLLLGSTSRTVVREAHAPVIVVRADDRTVPREAAGA